MRMQDLEDFILQERERVKQIRKDLDGISEFGEEFCALHCIESVDELRGREKELLDYVRERQEAQNDDNDRSAGE